MAQCGQEIPALVAFQHRVAQVTCGNGALGQPRDFATLLLNDGVEDVHVAQFEFRETKAALLRRISSFGI
jgi:hypothetical protein